MSPWRARVNEGNGRGEARRQGEGGRRDSDLGLRSKQIRQLSVAVELTASLVRATTPLLRIYPAGEFSWDFIAMEY